MVDALPLEWATVPASVAYALFEDPTTVAATARALEPVTARWTDAARASLHDPDFATAADACFGAARDALQRLDAPDAVVDPVARYHERYVRQGRCPADDLLDAWHETGRLVPQPESTPCAVTG
jgi:glutamate--cysteine ligase